MDNITLSKTAYEQLKRQAFAYRKFAANFFESLPRDSVKDVVDDFRKTNLYTDEFLNDLESGLLESSYSKNYGNKAVKKKSDRIHR